MFVSFVYSTDTVKKVAEKAVANYFESLVLGMDFIPTFFVLFCSCFLTETFERICSLDRHDPDGLNVKVLKEFLPILAFLAKGNVPDDCGQAKQMYFWSLKRRKCDAANYKPESSTIYLLQTLKHILISNV